MTITCCELYHDALRQPRIAIRYADGTEEDRAPTPSELHLLERTRPEALRSGGEYDQAALDEASRELHMFFLREGSRYGTKACEEIGRVFMTAYLKASPSHALECGAKPSSYGGGAACDQKWHCEECGDVTDTTRCPKSRQNTTLAALASAPSTTRRSDALKAWGEDVALRGPNAPRNDGSIKHMIEYLLTVYERFGNTCITANLQWGATAMWKRDELRKRVVELESELETARSAIAPKPIAFAQGALLALARDADQPAKARLEEIVRQLEALFPIRRTGPLGMRVCEPSCHSAAACLNPDNCKADMTWENNRADGGKAAS